MVRKLILAALLVGLLGVAAPTSLGRGADYPIVHDDEYPFVARLHVGHQQQKGHVYRFDWTVCEGIDCITNDWHGKRHFPDPKVLATAATKMKIVFAYHRKPLRIRLLRWRELDGEGQPVGAPVVRALRPRRMILDNGGTRWFVRFPRGSDPNYLDVRGRWREPRLGGNNRVNWTFATDTT